MLVLSRKLGERVIISLGGETVALEVLRINGQRVRIGVDAAPQVTVHREELWHKLLAEPSDRQPLPAAV